MDSPPYEQYDACPSCYGMCILEAHYCEDCGEVISGIHVRLTDGTRHCSECYSIDDILD